MISWKVFPTVEWGEKANGPDSQSHVMHDLLQSREAKGKDDPLAVPHRSVTSRSPLSVPPDTVPSFKSRSRRIEHENRW